jgi:hypothetical protein
MLFIVGVVTLFAFVWEYIDKKRIAKKKIEYQKIGELIFQNNIDEFNNLYNLYLNDHKGFKRLKKEYKNFDIEKFEPIDIFFEFGNSKQLLLMTDWNGEENEKEIEIYLEEYLKQKLSWTNADNLIAQVKEEHRNKGEFIVDLFKALDEDLQTINKKLLFFDLGDSYTYTVIDNKTYDEVISKSGKEIHGADKLKK